MFTALRALRSTWAGVLVLGVGLGDAGRAFALACQAAGAAGLFLESDAAVLRAAGREGCCNFTVTTLDEALRTLKLEVRRGRAVGVALGGASDAWVAEMVERGVLPAFSFGVDYPGAILLSVEELMARRLGFEVAEDVAGSLAERRLRDAGLADDLNREWLRVAPVLFPRELVRSYWVRVG